MMSDYKPANIQALAELMYKRECDYVGANHGDYCIAENVKTLQSFEDKICEQATEIDRLESKVAELEAKNSRILAYTLALLWNLLA